MDKALVFGNKDCRFESNITNQDCKSDEVGFCGSAEFLTFGQEAPMFAPLAKNGLVDVAPLANNGLVDEVVGPRATYNHADILAGCFDGDGETIDDAFNSVHPIVRTCCRLSCLFKDNFTRAKCLQIVREEWSTEACMSYWIVRICECCNSYSVAQQIEALVRDLVYSQTDSVEQLVSRYKTLSLDFDLDDDEDYDPGDSIEEGLWICSRCHTESYDNRCDCCGKTFNDILDTVIR